MSFLFVGLLTALCREKRIKACGDNAIALCKVEDFCLTRGNFMV